MNLGIGGLICHGVPPRVASALEHLGSRINKVWAQQHLPDGGHGLMTAQGFINGGVLALAGRGVISPPTLAASVNNYSPPGLSTAMILRLSASANVNITGLQPPDPAISWLWLLVNTGSANTITLTHVDAASAAYHQFRGPNSANVALGVDDGVVAFYDTTAHVTRLIGL